jgi:hypothetical protein
MGDGGGQGNGAAAVADVTYGESVISTNRYTTGTNGLTRKAPVILSIIIAG